MNANKALWEKGDFTRIADGMRASGRRLVEEQGLRAGMKVLDLGCGDGTTAIPAAQRGAEVTGVDIAANLVAAGEARAKALDLRNCRFLEGDASNLVGHDDGAYDRVVSMFGAMFAPKPHDVAREMVRVTKPGGRIVMGNWIPNDPTLVAQILKISSRYAPAPPPGFVSPLTWGVEDQVRERFASAGVAGDAVAVERADYAFDFAEPVDACVDLFRRFYGPTMNAFEAAAAQGQDDVLRQDLVALFASQNTATDPARTRIVATYLKVTVDRR